jgi:hypothetical protein
MEEKTEFFEILIGAISRKSGAFDHYFGAGRKSAVADSKEFTGRRLVTN